MGIKISHDGVLLLVLWCMIKLMFNSLSLQVKARLDAIQQKLHSDPKFRQGYPMQVAKEMQGEKQLEAQLVKQVRAWS